MLLTVAAAVASLALGPALARVAARLGASLSTPPISVPAAQLVRAGAAGATPPAGTPPGAAPARSPAASRATAAGTSRLTGLLFAAAAARFGADPVLPAFLNLVAVGVTLSLVDLRDYRLPNALTLPSYPIVAALLGAAALAGSPTGSFGRALLGGAGSYLLYLALRLASPRGVGFGDVKLAGVLGM